MAGASLFTLIDDIAALLDDIAVMTKVAVKKTAGVLGDDLALNAYQVYGIRPNRELPVVWAVARGSLVNKAILVPAALIISALAPWAIQQLLMIGGAYLCFEGVEKLVHRWRPSNDDRKAQHVERLLALKDSDADMVAFERNKIHGAIRTDFILSAEIIVISLGTVATQPFITQVGVLVAIALIMTVGVYGLVGGIVKLDDLGLALASQPGENWLARLRRWCGGVLIRSSPYLLKFLSVAGTLAMFLVGGGIIAHGVPIVHDAILACAVSVDHLPAGWLLNHGITLALELVVGLTVGSIAVVAVALIGRLMKKPSSHH